MTRHLVRLAAAALAVACPVSWATAHDLWLIPDPKAEAGQRLLVRANSGTKFPASDHAPDTAAFLARTVVGPDGRRSSAEAAGADGPSGLLSFTPGAHGVYVLAVETRPKVLTLDAAAFNEYLVSDGLPHVYKLRAKEKTLDRPATERYSKSPKALVRVGTGGAGDPCRAVGLPLEIVPLQDPFGRKAGEALPVRVLFRGEPLADANLGWDHPGGGEGPAGTVRTDARGEALVPLARAGLMTIRLTHITRPKAEAYEWESFWTTLTFRLPE
jgi:uncharacterized GH25 family protein